jgi:hypothetical protein
MMQFWMTLYLKTVPLQNQYSTTHVLYAMLEIHENIELKGEAVFLPFGSRKSGFGKTGISRVLA